VEHPEHEVRLDFDSCAWRKNVTLAEMVEGRGPPQDLVALAGQDLRQEPGAEQAISAARSGGDGLPDLN
jgi:hypothetical protein